MKKLNGPSMAGGIDRRGFLRAASGGLGLAAVASAGILTPTRGATARLTERGARELTFVNLHTGERVSAAYKVDGRLDPGALRDVNYVLRDWRTDEVTDMDVDTLDFIFDLQQTLGSNSPVEVISGYRSPRTNAMLAARSNGVARRSLHQFGKAVDINLPDQNLLDIAQTAFRMGRGGVGVYRRSGFVHVDSGRHRKWNF